MAIKREVVEHFLDDLDGTTAAEEIKFSLDGKAYVIDLSKKNAAALRKALEPYVSAGRRDSRAATARGKSATPRRSQTSKSDLDLADVRAWAEKNGHAVAARGRIAQGVVDEYLASRK